MFLAAWTAAQPELLAQGESESVPVTDAMLQAPASGDWPMWRRTLDGWGYEHSDVVFDDPGSRPVRRTMRADSVLNTLSGRISTTPDNQILVELAPDDIVPANLFDLSGRTLVFTPDGRGVYSRSVRALAWEEDLGNPVNDNAEIELGFRFEFSGREWESFFVSRRGLITFGEPYPFSQHGPDRWGTMSEIAEHLGSFPMISALYKPRLGGWSTFEAERFGNTQHVSRWPDRVVITWITTDPAFHVHGLPPKEKTRFQMALHADGRIAFHYAPEPRDPDEAIRDGIVGLFPAVAKTSLIGSVPDPVDGSLPAHLDLRETAIYMTSEPDLVLVEFTTRGPIRPVPDQELIYAVEIDTDEPWTNDREDQEFLWGLAVQPDGRRTAQWDATKPAYDSDADDNRIGLLVDSSEFAGRPASVAAYSGQWNTVTGSWRLGNGERSAVISFPQVTESAPTDLSQSGSSAVQHEVFHHTGLKDYLIPIACGVIKAQGDEFDAIVFHSQFRFDIQFPGSWWGYYPGNVPIRGIGMSEELLQEKSPCGSRMRGQWNFPIWAKSDFVAVADGSGGYAASPDGMWHLAHEFTHTWAAYVSYVRSGEREPLSTGSHWLPELHAPAPFARAGSIMGGSYWRENADGTFTPLLLDEKGEAGLSWLDLYLAGLATPDEVPDTFILRNLQEAGGGRRGPHTAEKEIVTMEQVLAAMGPRNPPAARSQTLFNSGFVYLLEPGQTPDPEQLAFHAEFSDQTVEHWRRITGGRSQITTAVPTLPNGSPVAVGTLPDLTLRAGGRAAVVDVAGAFRDPEGDPLTYRVASSAPAVATAVVAGSQAAVTPVSEGRATVTVTATDTGGLSAMQQFAVAVVVSSTFTDHPLRPGTTPIKAVHFHELRERIVALRVRSGLPVVGWTDPTLVAGVTPVKRVHLTELRSALDAAYDAVRRPRPAYTDAVVAAGVTAVKAAHIMELRSAVLLLESGTGTAP